MSSSDKLQYHTKRIGEHFDLINSNNTSSDAFDLFGQRHLLSHIAAYNVTPTD